MVSDLVRLNAATYAKYVGITDDITNDKSIYSCWGRDDDSSDNWTYITLQEAYEDYISVDNLSENSDDIDESQSSSQSTTHISSKLSEDPIANPIQPISKSNNCCCICEIMIENKQEILKCGTLKCQRNMHSANDCLYGITQYYDNHGRKSYCSISCFKGWTVYEVEILGEKDKNYKIKLNTGKIVYKSKSKVNKLAEFYKMVCIYNKKTQLQNDTPISPSSPDVEIIDVIASTAPNVQPTSQTKQTERTCCVCKQAMNEFNWKTCHTCGKDMHGKIICKKHPNGIIDVDGVVYCSSKCKGKSSKYV
jgi:hypothetical protein